LEAYVEGLLDTGYSRIPRVDSPGLQVDYRGTVQEHIRLLQHSAAMMEHLVRLNVVQEASKPLLLHHDYNKRNIFVSESNPEVITGIIDWQFTSIHPTFIYADDNPDFLFPHEKVEDLAEIELTSDATEAVRAAKVQAVQNRFDIVQKVFTTSLQGYMPLLWKARNIDQTILRPFRYCSTSWRNSAAAFRQELMELSDQWSSLGLPGECAYQPSKEERARHSKEFRDLEFVLSIRATVMELLKCDPDGWVRSDMYDISTELLHEIYVEYLETAKAEMTEEKAVNLWPFDLR